MVWAAKDSYIYNVCIYRPSKQLHAGCMVVDLNSCISFGASFTHLLINQGSICSRAKVGANPHATLHVEPAEIATRQNSSQIASK